MDLARRRWKILQKVSRDFTDSVKEFLVIGEEGDGLVMITKPNNEGFWFGLMKFEWSELEKSKEVTEPTRLEHVSNVVRMAQGKYHIVLLSGLGQIYTVGRNDWGQLGLGTIDGPIHYTPQLISDSSDIQFVDIRCGFNHSLALTKDGKVWAWGSNFNCQVGLLSSTPRIPSMHQISELDIHRIVAIECGGFHSLALTDQGHVYGWGYNGWGQLGHNNQSKQSIPARLQIASSSIIQIAAGFQHTLLLTNDGRVFACGWNNFGQLGLPISTSESFQICQVSGLPPISQIASHFSNSLSIALSTDDRRCYVWGQWNQASYSTPIRLRSTYSTIDSPLSFGSTSLNTPHSVRIDD